MKSGKKIEHLKKKSRRQLDAEFSAASALAEAAQAKVDTTRAKAAKAAAEADRALDEASCRYEEAIRKVQELKECIRAEKTDADASTADRDFEGHECSATRELLVKALGMLGSNQPGERENAARTAERLRVKLDKSWDELIIRDLDDDEELDDDDDDDE